MQVPQLFGLSDRKVSVAAVTGRQTIGDSIEQQILIDQAEGAASAVDAEIMGTRRNVGGISWVRPPARPGEPLAYARPIPDGSVWALVEVSRSEWSAVLLPKEGRPRVLVDRAGLEVAQGVAEDGMRSAGLTKFASASARWRSKPASPKQRNFASKLGINAAGMNAGQLSDAITATTATRRLAQARKVAAG